MGDLRVDIVDHIATVTLDRPPVNAVDTRHVRRDHRRVLRRSPTTVTSGSRSSPPPATGPSWPASICSRSVRGSAGGETPASLVTDPGRMARDAMWAITDCAVPVIGAINGPALGAGLAFAACCDILVASDNARFGTTEINVGLLGASAHLSLLVGRHKAREMFFTGEQVPAAELHRLGAVRASCRARSLLDSRPRPRASRSRRRARSRCGWPRSR